MRARSSLFTRRIARPLPPPPARPGAGDRGAAGPTHGCRHSLRVPRRVPRRPILRQDDPRQRRRFAARVNLEHLDRFSAAVMNGIQRVDRAPAWAKRETMRHELCSVRGVRRAGTGRVSLGVEPLFGRRGREGKARGVIADIDQIDAAGSCKRRRKDPLRPRYDNQIFWSLLAAHEPDIANRIAGRPARRSLEGLSGLSGWSSNAQGRREGHERSEQG